MLAGIAGSLNHVATRVVVGLGLLEYGVAGHIGGGTIARLVRVVAYVLRVTRPMSFRALYMACDRTDGFADCNTPDVWGAPLESRILTVLYLT